MGGAGAVVERHWAQGARGARGPSRGAPRTGPPYSDRYIVSQVPLDGGSSRGRQGDGASGSGSEKDPRGTAPGEEAASGEEGPSAGPVSGPMPQTLVHLELHSWQVTAIFRFLYDVLYCLKYTKRALADYRRHKDRPGANPDAPPKVGPEGGWPLARPTRYRPLLSISMRHMRYALWWYGSMV